jgi:hypothetical protein
MDYQFIYDVVTEQSGHKFHPVQIRYFGGVYTRSVSAVLVTHKVKNRIIRFKRVSTSFEPVTKTFGISHQPTHQRTGGIWKEAVDCHCRYDAYRCHVVPFSIVQQKKSAVNTLSDSGSGKPVKRNVTPRYDKA